MAQINLVEFPRLGISLELSNVAFSIFGFDIYWYGVLIGLGMGLAVLYAFKNAGRFGIDVDRMIDVIFVGFVSAIVCGRLYYVLFVDTSYRTFIDLINLRNGGIAIYGGIIGAFLGAFVACKWRKVPVLPMFDLTSMGFLIGQCLGRWGNFFNQEAFGSNTTGLFGMISPATTQYLLYHEDWLASQGMYVDPFMPVHPTFLYESVWCALGFLILWRYSYHRKFNGEIALFYAMWYGAGRFFIEGVRTDALLLPGLGIPVSQVVAGASVVIGLVVWLIAKSKTKGKPLQVPEIPPHTALVKVPTPDGEEEVTISWPANSRAPGKEERLDLAHTVLRARQAEEKKEKEAEEDTGTPDDEGEGDEKKPTEPDGEKTVVKPTDDEDDEAAPEEETPEEAQKEEKDDDGES